MLLKIERYKEREDWWILDDIRKISKAQFKQPFNQDFDGEVDADIFILDYMDHLEGQGNGQDSRDIIRLVCRLSNGNEFTVLFDTIAYILNDSGKTIEKLVANYR
ncbi:hypothetical protein LCGC14_1451110 [marine sediment metagenome]|uniref:Uncharacterized protein n=1 Tax=marine sediment metagenome TaxID=412755 RepID=A0A0F9JIK7_9ZZZZ